MILVFGGAGRQGQALVYALKKLVHAVLVVDQHIDSRDPFIKSLNNNWASCDAKAPRFIANLLASRKPELVISCLPYFLNWNVAKECIDQKIPYFDLGGHVGTSKAINDYSESHDGQVFTDLGLAPGLVNIMAEESYRKINKIDEVKAIQMFCGGLPLCKEGLSNPPFNYGRTWSTEGLINEYKDDCLVLENGKVKTAPGMSGIEDHSGGWEAFYTSGGIGKTLYLMKDRGVLHCSYKTLRNKGHIEAVHTLIEAGFGSDFFDKLFPVITKDYVHLEARANGIKSYYRNELSVYSDDRFTAMQRATAFPVATIAHMFVNGNSETFYRDEIYEGCFNYSNIDYNQFSLILGDLGIEL